MELLDSYALKNHVDFLTHEKGNTLDLIITRDKCELNIHDVKATSFISDHSFIIARTSLDKPNTSSKTISYRKIKDISIEDFKSDLSHTRLCQNPPEDLDELVDYYDEDISTILEKHAPLITKDIKLRAKSDWYTPELGELKLAKKKSEYKWLRTKDIFDHEEFKAVRNRYVYECRI